MVTITLYILLQFDKILISQYQQLFKAENGISAKVYDVISNVTTVIILRIEKLVQKSIIQRMMKPYALFINNSKVNEVKWFLASVCGALTTFLVMATYLYGQVRASTVIAVGTIYLLYGYVQNINGLFYNFAYLYGTTVQQKTAVMNAEEIAREFKNKNKIRDVQLGNKWKQLEVSALNFSYHTKEGANLHLDNVSFTIKRGEKIALVGASGSGKTTLLKIIRALYEPRQLTLRLDGTPIKGGFKAISSEISLIPQDPEIFATTIKENITIGVDMNLSRIRTYTDMAQFTTVVERLPKKFDSSII